MVEVNPKIKEKIQDVIAFYHKLLEFYHKLRKREFPLFKNKLFKTCSIVAMSLLMLLFLIPLLMDSSDLKLQIEEDVSKSLSGELTIYSDISVSFLPPSISAKNVILKGYENNGKTYNIFAKVARIDLSFLDMLFGKIEVEEILLSHAVLETYHSLEMPDRNNDFTIALEKLRKKKDKKIKRSKKRQSKYLSQLPVEKLDPSKLGHEHEIAFNIENSSIVSYDKTGNITRINNIFSEISLGNDSFSGYGEFLNSQMASRFSFEANFDTGLISHDSFFRLTSPIADFKIDGKFTSENKGILNSDFEGRISGKIIKLKNFYRTYVGSNRAIFEKLQPGTRIISVSGDIVSKEGESEIKDVMIRSDVINGKGEVSFNFTKKNPIVDINFAFEDVDLDKLWSSGSVAFKKNPQHVKKIYHHDETLDTINLSKTSEDEDLFGRKINNIDLTSEIKIKKAKYLGGEIEDIDLYLVSSKNDEIMLLPMIFKVPGKGTVRINGVIYRDDNFPKLIGKIDVSGENLQSFLNWIKFKSKNLKLDHLKEYILYSDIMLNPNLIKMSNLYLNVNNDESEFLGEITIDDSAKTSRTDSKFRVSAFNADDYFLISGQNEYLSPGNLLHKVLWLNEINSDNSFEMDFEKLTYKGEDFFDQAVTLKFGQGYLEIKDLKLKSDKTDLSANILVNISDEEPTFDMNVVANSFSYTSLSDNNLLGTDNQTISAADQFFALPSLEDFKGEISLDIANLELDDLKIKNAKLYGNLLEGRMPRTTVSFNLYDTDFNYEGLIGVKYNKTISGSFSYLNVELQKLLPGLINLDKVGGLANIVGKISASASTKDEFLDHITSEIKFNVAVPVIKDYGLKDLVNKMFYYQRYREDLKKPEDILFNADSQTTFSMAKGVVKIYRDHINSFKIDFQAPFINGVISGKTDIVKKDIDATAKIVFLTGSAQKQYPINIATALKGKFDNFSQATNLDQVRIRLGLDKPAAKPDNKGNESVTSSESAAPLPNDNLNQVIPVNDKEKIHEDVIKAMQNPDLYLQQIRNKK